MSTWNWHWIDKGSRRLAFGDAKSDAACKIMCQFDIDIGPVRVQEDWPLEMLKVMLPVFSHKAETCVKAMKLGNVHTVCKF